MSADYLGIPHGVTTTSATIWVGTTLPEPAHPVRVVVEHPHSGSQWPVDAWSVWPTAGDIGTSIRYRSVDLSGLQPNTRYPLVVRVDGVVKARLEVTTLPTRLPYETEPSFNIMVGSCFCRMQDDDGSVGKTFAQLPDGAKPHLKFLMGDQVYLDSPFYKYFARRSETTLARWFLDNYVNTWGQDGLQQGFNHLLTGGANYFCADDHEFWNNAPFFGALWVNTWSAAGRAQWWSLAEALYTIFQSDRVVRAIEIGDLSVRIVDTRIKRQHDHGNFIPAADMTTLENWVANLKAPGLLVLGQPIFAGKAGPKGHLTDWNLPDFTQYADLCKILLSSRQSIVILSGDVHYGRIASARLPSGAELVEIISSPMSLVDKSSGESWSEAPFWFPDAAIPGVGRIQIGTLRTWKRFANHFITLELNQRGGGLNLRVRTWETQRVNGVPGGMVVAERTLKRMA
jgi:hypothetical protein